VRRVELKALSQHVDATSAVCWSPATRSADPGLPLFFSSESLVVAFLLPERSVCGLSVYLTWHRAVLSTCRGLFHRGA
jgi:hypothetical protein